MIPSDAEVVMAQRWEPRDELTDQERSLMMTVRRTKKLFGFLRVHRRELFDDSFQDELAAVYRDTGAGKAPHPPALMAMVVLLQAYTGTSDAEAVQQCVVDLRWQMVLDCLGARTAPFSQGSLHDFRQRLIRHDLDRRLLERTADLATRSGSFDGRKLPKTLRVAVDSKPLQGAGRVEDTMNLLGHAAREVVHCVAELLDEDVETVAHAAGIPLVLETSTKKALDTDWSDPKQRRRALNRLVEQLRGLLDYVGDHLPEQAEEPPLQGPLQALRQVLEQDLEPDPDDPKGERVRIRKGVAKDRRVSVRDPSMRHGRKSKSKAFNGFKQHVAMDLDRRIILACAICPANHQEAQAAPALRADLLRYGFTVDEWHVDRGYISSELVREATSSGIEVVSKPRHMAFNNGLFTKHDFDFDLRARTVTCPAGRTKSFEPGQKVQFGPVACNRCKLRRRCTASRNGRSLQIASDELLQQRFHRRVATRAGRARLRLRVAVEHRLAHLKQKQGDRARYLGQRKNLFDLRRTASILNLEVAHQDLANAA